MSSLNSFDPISLPNLESAMTKRLPLIIAGLFGLFLLIAFLWPDELLPVAP